MKKQIYKLIKRTRLTLPSLLGCWLCLWPLLLSAAELSEAEQDARIAALLKQARQAAAEDRLTIPSGCNAVSYAQRHNEANGEDNNDGHAENYSANWGVEGPTDDSAILDTRRRLQRALLATLFRPATVGGQSVQMRVRIPYEFAIRDGAGRIR